jgi:signal transduction histidine kinase
MLADVVEGMRGRFVTELERRAPLAHRRGFTDTGRRARLDAHVGQLIEALRGGAPGDWTPACSAVDPEFELAEHDLLERCLNEQIVQKGLNVAPVENAIVHGWRCRVDRRCLREQNKRLSALLDDVHESAAMLSPEGRILYCNRQAAADLCEAARVPRYQVIGRTPCELGVPMELVIGRPIGELVELARAHESFEVTSAGRATETQFDAIYGADGEVNAVALLMRDVHGRKLAQQRLDLLSKLGALVGVLDYDQVAEGLARVPIPELADWCSFSLVEDDRIRRTFLANRDPSQAPLREAIMRALPGWDRHPLWQEMLTHGFQLLTEVSDDLLRRLAVNERQYQLVAQIGIRSLMIVPLVSRTKVTGVVTFAFTSQSGRRYGGDDPELAEEVALHAAHALENAWLMKDLKASEARFRVALAGARTVVFEQDTSLRYTWYYNPLTATDLQGKAPEESLPADEAAVLRTTKRRVIENGEGLREEIDLTLGSDERRHYRESIEPKRDQTGKVVGIIGAATDITELQHMQQQLIDDVSFRERMMGILSHDLRTPLNAIIMASDRLLRDEARSSTEGEPLKRIRRAAERMQEMIETLLDFTRLRYLGRFPVSPAPTNLGDVSRGVVDEMRAARPDRRIELSLDGDLKGEWDPARVGQAISNLVANGIAYSAPESPVRVAVNGNAGAVVVTVHNQGTPIHPGLLAVIFEPFRRGVPEDRSPHGLGLGLHIVQQIALAHGGRVAVESTAEAGTTFTVRLPRAPAARKE